MLHPSACSVGNAIHQDNKMVNGATITSHRTGVAIRKNINCLIMVSRQGDLRKNNSVGLNGPVLFVIFSVARVLVPLWQQQSIL